MTHRRTTLPGSLLGLMLTTGMACAVSAADDLPTATPESRGMDSSLLESAISAVENDQYGDINALLVMRGGDLVLEHYFSPEYFGPNYRYSVRSVTKTVTSILVGIALDQGLIDGVDTPVLEFLPAYTDLANPDPRKEAITLSHVLSMTAGLEWDELSTGYGDPANDVNRMAASADWIRHVLDRPMVHDPGTVLEYSSGLSVLLSGVLETTTGGSAEDFAAEHLFGPIGIERWSWALTPGNRINTGWGLGLTRRDMARIGLLFQGGGRWNGHQVVSTQWISESTREHAGGDPDSFIYRDYAYGYQWWRLKDHDPVVRDLPVNDVYFAWGDGGQMILVSPQLELVVVSTGELHGADFRRALDLTGDFIIPAAR